MSAEPSPCCLLHEIFDELLGAVNSLGVDDDGGNRGGARIGLSLSQCLGVIELDAYRDGIIHFGRGDLIVLEGVVVFVGHNGVLVALVKFAGGDVVGVFL